MASLSHYSPSSSSASHPIGTTVRVQEFLTNIPVRRQAALKATTIVSTNVRKLLSAYAFARPEVRFSFKVLKAKNEKANWSYAPNSANSSLTEAASKIVGKDVASRLLLATSASLDQPDAGNASEYRLEVLLVDPRSGMSIKFKLPVH
jgi:DNA mismatch repair ATPase MutL